MSECLNRRLFGSPFSRATVRIIKALRPGATLFLFTYDTRELYGGFCAESYAKMSIVPEAFGGRFPLQVKVQTFPVARTFLTESEFYPILAKNYFSKLKFDHFLTRTQVDELMRLFNGQQPDVNSSTVGAVPLNLRPVRPSGFCIPLRRPLNRFVAAKRRDHQSNSRSLLGTGRESLEEVLRLPPYLRTGPLFKREDTLLPIPDPPSPQDPRTTVAFGPLPPEADLKMSALVTILEGKVESKYDFLLVQFHNKERWCYINFRQDKYVPSFVELFRGHSLFRLTNGAFDSNTPLNVLYWKWQGAHILGQLFKDGDWSPYKPTLCHRFLENRAIFFYGAGRDAQGV